MKIPVWFMVISMFIGCTSVSQLTGFRFYDANGGVYNSLTAPSVFKKEFNLNNKPKMLIIATSSKSNQKYKLQIEAMNKINAEEMEYLYILANSEEENNSGYYMTKLDSSNILKGNYFRVIIYDQFGKIIKESTKIIGEKELITNLGR